MPKNGKKGQKMLAPSDQIQIRQQSDAPKRYTGALAPSSEIMIKQTKDAKDLRY